jgi:hypothetical protein
MFPFDPPRPTGFATRNVRYEPCFAAVSVCLAAQSQTGYPRSKLSHSPPPTLHCRFGGFSLAPTTIIPLSYGPSGRGARAIHRFPSEMMGERMLRLRLRSDPVSPIGADSSVQPRHPQTIGAGSPHKPTGLRYASRSQRFASMATRGFGMYGKGATQ